MAIFNEILVGRFNRGLQKLFAIKSTPPVRQLSGEILPTHPLFNGTENRYLEGWNRFGVFGTQASGGAGTFARFRLRNPKGSNVIAVIEKVSGNSVAGAFSQMSVDPGQTADLATLTAETNTRLDARGNPQPTCIASHEATAIISGTILAQINVTATILNFEFLVTDLHEVSLLPGDAYNVTETGGNNAMNVAFWWRERFLEESERA